MDFLKHLALPQSQEHINVLHFVLNFANTLFIPFLSLLFGLTLISLFYNRKGRIENNSLFLEFAKDVIDIIVINKSILFLLGVVPYLAILAAYAQLLQASSASTTLILTWGFAVFVFAVVSIYSYQVNFRLSRILQGISGSDEIDEFRKETYSAYQVAGKWGFFMLLAGIYFFIAGVEHANDVRTWESSSIFTTLFSFKALIKFFQFILFSLAISSVGVLYFLFVWNGGKKNISQEYSAVVKSSMLPVALISLLLIPVFIVLQIVVFPEYSLTGRVFGFAFLALLFVFFVSHAVYGLMKEFKPRFVSNAFFLMTAAIFFNVISEQSAFVSATSQHSAVLAYQYEKYRENLLTKMGISLKVFTGEDIFVGKCSACHEFGNKKVGPSYKSVLPKYENNKNALIEFILNPVKKDPAFPPMPNQGLKPAEADSIAAYIIRMYKQ